LIQLEELKPLCLLAEYVGSRVTCDPPPTDTDLDILVLTFDETRLHERLVGLGYEIGGSRINSEVDRTPPDLRFSSYTKDEVNIIMTSSKIFYDRFILATKVCKHINLKFKEHRIALFQAIVYGNAPI
jgi:predicted nucleotidyltransferase